MPDYNYDSADMDSYYAQSGLTPITDQNVVFQLAVLEQDLLKGNYTNDNIDVGGYRANFVYRTLKAGGKYYYLFRVDNTVLYAYGGEANMGIINQIASELGYVDD